MDVDGSSVAPSSGDIDQNLLLQFSCMNTTDREELISQVQKLLGPSVNYNTASFFLDMNSWNIQAAVCSYLDYYQPPKPSMSLKATVNHEGSVMPGAKFEQSWYIANTGTEFWPTGCQLVQAGGEPLGASGVFVPAIPAGHSWVIVMPLTAPGTVGKHRGYFHLMTNQGVQFGDTLWAEITVESENAMAIVDQMAAMPVPSSRDDQSGETHFQQGAFINHVTLGQESSVRHNSATPRDSCRYSPPSLAPTPT